jgi:hypothetical protein
MSVRLIPPNCGRRQPGQSRRPTPVAELRGMQCPRSGVVEQPGDGDHETPVAEVARGAGLP